MKQSFTLQSFSMDFTNGGKPNPLPQLTIKGRWLEQLGFTKGQPVSITAEHGQLTIRTMEENV